MEAVFKSVLEEQSGEHPLRLFWRELRHWPGSVAKAHLRGRRRNMTLNEKPLPRQELLAAMTIFILPLFSLFAVTGLSLPQWTDYILLVIFWGGILFALGLAAARRLPGWSLPYLGFAVMLALVASPYWTVWEWIYPIFINAYGARVTWSIPVRIFYVGVFEFILSTSILLSAFLLVNLLRLPPYTRAVWKRIREDWTQLSFMLYGGLVFYIVLAFDEYRYNDPWKFAAWVFLALGAWLYLRAKGQKQRIHRLVLGATCAMWTVSLAIWVLIPLQAWPTGYPIAPSEATRWVATSEALLGWLFILWMLYAPSLIKWLPPLPESVPPEDEGSANTRTA
jgi:hypothetical protein